MDRYSSYSELGQKVKAKNPGLTKSDEDVGRWYAEKHSDEVEVEPAHWLNRTMDAAAAPSRWINENVPSPVDVAGGAAGLLSGGASYLGDALRDASLGVGKGMTFGGISELHKRLDPTWQEPDTFAHAVGEVIGETLGPYKLTQAILKGPAGKWAYSKVPKYLQESPRLRRALGVGGEAAFVEGTKAFIRGDDITPNAAVGFLAGAGPLGLVYGAGKLGKWGVEKAVGMKDADISEKAVAFMRKYDIPLIPSFFAPGSTAIGITENRLFNTNATKATLNKVRNQLVSGIDRMRVGILDELGPNAAVKDPTEVGKGILRATTAAKQQLAREVDQVYKDFRPMVADLPIVANKEYKRLVPNKETGELVEETGSLAGNLEKLLGGEIPFLAKGPRKRLMRWYQKSKASWSGQQPKTYGQADAPEWSGGISGPRVVNQGPDTPLRGLTFRTYDQWWKELQDIGAILDEPAVKQNPKARRLVLQVYHTVQDAMDEQAIAYLHDKNPAYAQMAQMARGMHQNKMNFQNMDLLLNIEAVGEGGKRLTDHAAIVGKLFGNADSINTTKRFLGPEAYDTARQAFLRDLLWDAIELDKNGNVQWMSGMKLQQNINKFSDGVDSELFRKLFSDEGFVSPQGEAISASTGGAEKHEMLKELVKMSRRLDLSVKRLHPGQEQLQQAQVERFVLAEVVTDPPKALQRMRLLVAHILMSRKAAEKYFEQDPLKNVYMGAEAPQVPLSDIPLPNAVSRILGRQGRPEAIPMPGNRLRQSLRGVGSAPPPPQGGMAFAPNLQIALPQAQAARTAASALMQLNE